MQLPNVRLKLEGRGRIGTLVAADWGNLEMKKIHYTAFGVLASLVAMPAIATTTLLTATGNIAGSDYTAYLNLDVVNGQAQSGTGTFTFLSYTNAPITLITTSTPGNETAGGAQYPVGFRANDGTDLFGADQAYPLTIGGLLFAINTTSPTPRASPLLNLYSDNGTLRSLFTGNVGGREIYAATGTLTIAPTATGAVPEPATWAMMLVGFGGMGYAMRRNRKAAVSFT